MSTTTRQTGTRAPLRCPSCSATVGVDQDWCLECGAPARTRMLGTPNWKLPTAALIAVAVVALAVLAFAFVKLTAGDNTPTAAAPARSATPTLTTATTPLPAASAHKKKAAKNP